MRAVHFRRFMFYMNITNTINHKLPYINIKPSTVNMWHKPHYVSLKRLFQDTNTGHEY